MPKFVSPTVVETGPEQHEYEYLKNFLGYFPLKHLWTTNI
jgi:hypothetical protein